MNPIYKSTLILLCLVPLGAAAENSFAVIVPESIEGRWYWHNTVEAQHLVQARIEKSLLQAGHKLVDLSVKTNHQGLFQNDTVAPSEQLVEWAKARGVTHIIAGRAVAVGTDPNDAHGVNVYRSQADISIRVIETGSSHIVMVETGEAMEGGQGYMDAGKKALKSAARDLSKKLVKQLESMKPAAAE